jgi:hypothetical protein
VITGCVYVDLTVDPDDFSRDRRQLAVLEHCPDGARVVVDIGRRRYVTHDAAIWLHEHDHRLAIEIHGVEPDAVLRFVQAARAGDWSVVA